MQARTRRDATRGVRVPASPRPRAERVQAPRSERPVLRLALARGALAIELDEPFELGPLRVEELSLRLPAVRFPVDLSGGVTRFRHQRGELDRLHVAVRAAAVEVLAATRWRGLLGGAGPVEVTVAPFVGGAVVGVAQGPRALAFDLHLAPLDGSLRVLVDRARGLGLEAPAHALALRALSALAGAAGRVERGVLVIDDVAGPVLRALLPLGGARVPSLVGLRAHAAPPPGPGWSLLRIERDAAPAPLEPVALRLLEVAEIAGDADDASARGALEEARAGYLAALERAPRHPAIAHRLAAIDRVVGGRADAALATLVEVSSALEAGVLGAELLAAVHDRGGAHAAFMRAAAEEPWSRLAAMAWLEAARLAPDPAARAHALDEALARGPLLDEARWERLASRIASADVAGARADAELLEAGRRGAAARLDAAARAGRAFLDAGYAVEATRWFERALRVAPDDAGAVLGLARALRDAGKPRRALDLFARAVSLAERAGAPASAALLELAKELVDTAADRPAAVRRAQAIGPDRPEAAEARALEVRWRLELGDRAGASLAASRLADALELAVDAGALGLAATPATAPAIERAGVAAASIAREAAALVESELGDADLARRLLALAVRAAPHDRRAAGELRRLGRRPPSPPPPPPEPSIVSDDRATTAIASEPAAPPTVAAREMEADGGDIDPLDDPAGGAADAEDEALVDRLSDRLRADPGDHATALRLADVLERLGRDMELLALLSARGEEGGDDVRRELAPRRRACLLRLAEAARSAGRSEEAGLYEALASSE